MSRRSAIFISAVGQELGGAATWWPNTLVFLGYDSGWLDVFETEEGDRRAMLRRRIASCDAVVQFVGQCYGSEPSNVDERFSFALHSSKYCDRLRHLRHWCLRCAYQSELLHQSQRMARPGEKEGDER